MLCICYICGMSVTFYADVDSPCSEFDHGSPLHIAVRNLCFDSAQILIANEADPHAGDMNGKTPIGMSVIVYLLCSHANFGQFYEATSQLTRELSPQLNFNQHRKKCLQLHKVGNQFNAVVKIIMFPQIKFVSLPSSR